MDWGFDSIADFADGRGWERVTNLPPLTRRATSEVRWMTAFDTTPEDVDAFAAAIVHEVGRAMAAGATR